jgi:acetyl esterase/lipase
MRVPHALAAVAAIGALVYGFADPLNSALTASTKAQESSASASQAEIAANVTVKVRAKAKAKLHSATRLSAALQRVTAKAELRSRRGPAAGPKVTPAPAQTAPHASESGLGQIRRERDKHRSASPKPVTDAKKTHALVPKVISAEETYGPAINQRVTVSRLNTATGRRPTVYFVHGGSWIVGGQGEWAAEANRWASKGWTAVNISYRLNVKGRYMLSDVRKVVSDFERRSYVDPERQIIVGSSAGAHLATSIAVRYPTEFRGVIAWSPVISPEVAAEQVHSASAGSKFRLAQAARRLWSADWRSASPVNYVTDASPPLWAAAARGEWLRWSDQGDLLCRAMGDRCTATIVPGRSHGAQLANSHADLRDRALKWAQARV